MFINLSMHVKGSSIFASLFNDVFFAFLHCRDAIRRDIRCGRLLELGRFLEGGRSVGDWGGDRRDVCVGRNLSFRVRYESRFLGGSRNGIEGWGEEGEVGLKGEVGSNEARRLGLGDVPRGREDRRRCCRGRNLRRGCCTGCDACRGRRWELWVFGLEV